MRKIESLFAEYAESHRNKTNKAIHWLCVPLIFWAMLGFVSLIPSPHLYIRNFGAVSIVSLVAVAAVTVFYFRLSVRLAIIMLVIMIILEYFVYSVNVHMQHRSWILFLSVFIIAWIGQFYGHKIEGKKPSFLKDLQFLLVGPAWLLSFILKKCHINL
ncbi:Mpo1 family 2-hydroxy fatty acid dioxygenase [Kaistella palustris]|uniref:Mpo1 family 2-hydroxy fatty acid dioxygenase n=1 Tax=Kaistella palustris TaxID=493376 RepID=UPI00042884EF|nr:Mpo1-like protein [Kaistella palustris]